MVMPVNFPSGPAHAILAAVRRRLLNTTAAGPRVYSNRDEALAAGAGGAEVPALALTLVSDTPTEQLASPKGHRRELRFHVVVVVSRDGFRIGQSPLGVSLGTSESRHLGELVEVVRALLHSDPLLKSSSPSGEALVEKLIEEPTAYAFEAGAADAFGSAALAFSVSYVQTFDHYQALAAKALAPVHVEVDVDGGGAAVAVSSDIDTTGS